VDRHRPVLIRAETAREAVLAVMRAASWPMTTTQIWKRLQLIGEDVSAGDVLPALKALARGPEVFLGGRVTARPGSEGIWAYRVPDEACVRLDEVED
jgi:hypothetical protein